MDNIRLIFVLSEKYSDETEVSGIMLQAFEACKQNVKTQVSWIKESNFNSINLNKTDFVIFEDFKGKVFESLKETKCARILGPWAVSICLMEGKAIPNFPWPIFNVAMYGCTVTSSNLSKNIKLEIKEKVQRMGGCYIEKLLEKVTHLVTDNPKSEKYLMAAEAGVTLMCSSWINAVWVASQTANTHANDKEFEQHKCLPFQNFQICCTGLSSSKDRKDLETLITKYGGKYSPQLNLTETDVLVCSGIVGATSEKYKAARKRTNIHCVDIAWIQKSIEKGYALPHNLFKVKKGTSTPTKNNPQLNPDFSSLSAISGPNNSRRILVDESTINVNQCSPHFGSPHKPGPSKRRGNLKEDYGQLVDNLHIKKAKKAGQYLDGCIVYITGFNPEHTEKLCKIFNLSGATRYDQFSERVTHVIVGDPKYHEVNIIKSKGYQSLLVSVQWLLDSIEKEQPANEERYRLSASDFDRSDFNSPLSKKGLKLLQSNKTITETEVKDIKNELVRDENNIENYILQQYLQPTRSAQEDDTLAQLLKGAADTNFFEQIQEPPKGTPEFALLDTSMQQSSVSVTQDESSQSRTHAEGMKFLVIGFEDSRFEQLKMMIEGLSGDLVSKSYKGIPDFIVVPIFNKNELRYTATEIVNELYIDECTTEGDYLPEIMYYHRPINIPDTTPLETCCITITSYIGYERNFLKYLVEALGGHHQEQFARVTSKTRGFIASTHLVTDKLSGKKYSAAVKWCVPVVNKDWLLECARTGHRVPETNYVVDDGGVCGAENTTSCIIDLTKKTTVKTEISSDITSNLNTSFSADEIHVHAAVKDISNTSISTPEPLEIRRNSRILTPVNQMLPRNHSFNDSTNKPLTQATPVNQIIRQYRESNLYGTSGHDSPQQFRWMGIKTPDTPLGACISANPSAQLRKECDLWLRQFPDFDPPLPRRLSTPLSEIKRQLWSKILDKGNENLHQSNSEPEENRNKDEEIDVVKSLHEEVCCSPGENTQNRLINNRLQQLEEMLGASGGGRRQSRNFQSTIPIPGKEGNSNYQNSQACTVGWDFRDQEVAPKLKIFILSGITDSARAQMVEQIESLGASVSDLSSYDPSGTHLLCPKAVRNEKTLSCMAAGKWCIHISYLEKSFEAGYFLDEEEYEFGNPKSLGNFEVPKDTEARTHAMYWWRQEVTRRGYGAFNDVRAIVVARDREPIIRVIEAGGGMVIDLSPPFEDTVHATHCLLEHKSVRNYTDYIPLAQQGIYLLNTVYISDYLYQPNKDIREFILPYFAKYYSRD